MVQRLHLVFGGEPTGLSCTLFEVKSDRHAVGIFRDGDTTATEEPG
ncbi:hypothetical protein ROA7745_02278 [Roseovarius aestuarii]|uniref:Uncharacterized protein n=1 Tax=Roseovarius aestuarii TaxID=475083 RepID=A0A1X7BS64_9RHOB|nr:hypothetical protein ROA7745_02278 [Roseovarius aestuarii]